MVTCEDSSIHCNFVGKNNEYTGTCTMGATMYPHIKNIKFPLNADEVLIISQKLGKILGVQGVQIEIVSANPCSRVIQPAAVPTCSSPIIQKDRLWNVHKFADWGGAGYTMGPLVSKILKEKLKEEEALFREDLLKKPLLLPDHEPNVSKLINQYRFFNNVNSFFNNPQQRREIRETVYKGLNLPFTHQNPLQEYFEENRRRVKL